MAKRDWFCEDVLSFELKVKTVWEDKRVLAFHHPRPKSKIHVVVIPKDHVKSILHRKVPDVTPHMHWHILGPGVP